MNNIYYTNTKLEDWMTFGMLLMMLMTRILTLTYMTMVSGATGAEINNVVEVLEVNPFAKYFIFFDGIRSILFILVGPAFVFGLYMVYRSLVKAGRMEHIGLRYYTTVIFVTMLLNVVNDATIFTATYMRLN